MGYKTTFHFASVRVRHVIIIIIIIIIIDEVGLESMEFVWYQISYQNS